MLPPPPNGPTRTVVATVPTARAALRAAVEPLLAYAFALAAAVGLMVLVVLAIAVGSDGGDAAAAADDIDIEAIGVLVGMPFQLAGMALGGSLRLGDGAFRVSLFAPPLLVTAVFTIAAFLLSRRAETARPSASAPERVLLAASGGVVTAVVVVVATRSLAMRDEGLSLHAASVGLFFGVLALAFASGLLGRLAAHGSLWPHWLPADGRRAAHLVSQYVLVFVAAGIPVAVLWLLVDAGPEAALFAVVWGPTVALVAFGMGHLGALSVPGSHEFAWDLGWFPGVVLPLLALLLTVTAATAWHLRRGEDRELLAQPASWTSLACAFGAAALPICLLSTVGISGGLFELTGGVTFGVAYWLIPVLAVWGAVIEVLSRFVAPSLASAVPGPIARRLAVGPSHLRPPAPVPVQRIPMSPSDRARAKKALIGAAVVGGLGLGVWIVVSVVGSSAYSPESYAEDYLDALVEGDAERAAELSPVDDDEAADALLTNEVYEAAGDRITGYEITDLQEFGDTVTVTVDLEGVENGDGVELSLEEDGSRALFFSAWKVTDGGLASELTVSVPESSSSVEVNGVEVPAGAGSDVDLWALPGSYVVNPYGDSEWLEPVETETVVSPGSWGTYAETPEPEPSEALTTFVQTEIEGWVEGCMTATEPDPADCPQEIYPYGDEQRNLEWRLDQMPTVSWDGFYGSFPANLSSDAPGEASATYEYDDSYGFGKPSWVEETETSTFYVSVEVDLDGDEPRVTFDSY